MWTPARRSLTLALVAFAVLATGQVRAAGQPDLGGLWTSASLTELERPARFKALTASDAEAAAYEQQRPAEILNAEIDDVGGRQSETTSWNKAGAKLARIGGQARTSWIVEPADGHLPYSAAGKAERARRLNQADDAAGPEDRTSSERCLLSGWAASTPPMLNAPYSNLYQIVQTADQVAISMEANHDVRIIRLNQAHHLPASIRPWMGDSIGHWEGRTLVAETTNFNPGDAFRMPMGLLISMDAKVTERFTRLGPTKLLYQFAVDDPATYSSVWRGEMLLETTKGPIYEYACHEGNYSLPGILAGARHQEAQGK
jgi:hypothetical protein